MCLEFDTKGELYTAQVIKEAKRLKVQVYKAVDRGLKAGKTRYILGNVGMKDHNIRALVNNIKNYEGISNVEVRVM